MHARWFRDNPADAEHVAGAERFWESFDEQVASDRKSREEPDTLDAGRWRSLRSGLSSPAALSQLATLLHGRRQCGDSPGYEPYHCSECT